MRTPRIVATLTAVATLALGACATPPATAHPPGPTATGLTANGPAAAAPTASPSASSAPTLPGTTRAGTRPPVITNGSRTGNEVALTFDADMTDGMLYNLETGRVASYANLKVIDELERRHVPATFFLTGQWAQRYPDVTRRLAANPDFELANHSFKHQGFTPNCYGLGQVPHNLMAADVAKTFSVIEAYRGRQTRYFRFPGGCHDATALQALAPLGLTVVQWDVVSGDPFAKASEPIVNAVLSGVRPGSIVVMHVTEANAAFTDEALPHILDGLAARNLRPVALSDLLAR